MGEWMCMVVLAAIIDNMVVLAAIIDKCIACLTIGMYQYACTQCYRMHLELIIWKEQD